MPPTIPSDEVLAKMTSQELSALANRLAKDDTLIRTERVQAAMEWLSDALLRVHKGWLAGAHSEDPDTRWNVHIRQTQRIGLGMDLADEDLISEEVVSQECLRKAIGRAARAGCTRGQRIVFGLHEAGCTQREIGEKLGIPQQKVPRQLAMAKAAIRRHIDRLSDPVLIFDLEARRRALGKIRQQQPPMDARIAMARLIIEEAEGVSTLVTQREPLRLQVTMPSGEVLTLNTPQILARARAHSDSETAARIRADLESRGGDSAQAIRELYTVPNRPKRRQGLAIASVA